MATTTQKRDRTQALADAEAFRAMFPTTAYERWEFAGSIRRGKPAVSDVEHVIIPRMGDVPGAGLFGEPERVNLLWHCLDALLSGRKVEKHLYGSTESGAPLYRWGDKYRGVDFRGFNHELFCADADNWGAVLLIRTGPAEYSQRVVTALKDGGMYRQSEGYLRDREGHKIPVPDERSYLLAAGLKWQEPAARS